MAHKHPCRICDESFICPKGTDECYENHFTCRDCGGGFWRFLAIAALTFAVIWLTVILFSEVREILSK